jgi:prepilin signal peptidase PulO-like enzyme (type II secretory pathway)
VAIGIFVGTLGLGGIVLLVGYTFFVDTWGRREPEWLAIPIVLAALVATMLLESPFLAQSPLCAFLLSVMRWVIFVGAWIGCAWCVLCLILQPYGWVTNDGVGRAYGLMVLGVLLYVASVIPLL